MGQVMSRRAAASRFGKRSGNVDCSTRSRKYPNRAEASRMARVKSSVFMGKSFDY